LCCKPRILVARKGHMQQPLATFSSMLPSASRPDGEAATSGCVTPSAADPIAAEMSPLDLRQDAGARFDFSAQPAVMDTGAATYVKSGMAVHAFWRGRAVPAPGMVPLAGNRDLAVNPIESGIQ
jgi:hypothetical protein